MKKIKKFFKDVFGEIKEPSEDAGKVLEVIRRVIRLAVFMSILFYIVNLIINGYYLVNMYTDGHISDYIKYSDKSWFSFIFPHVKSIIRLTLYIIIFVFCNRSLKTGKLVKSKIFPIILIIIFAFQFTNVSLNISSIFGTLFSTAISASILGIIMHAFYDINVDESTGMESSEKHIRTISLLGYMLLIVQIIRQLPSIFIWSFTYLSNIIQMYKYTSVTIWEWFIVISIILKFIVFLSIIALLVFSLIGRKKELVQIREKSYLLFVILFISILADIFQYLIFDGGYLYFIVFALAVSYQNKYKVFDNIGTRTFKKAIEKVKTGLDNYLSVGK